MTGHLWSGAEWSFKLIDKVYREIEKIGTEELGMGAIYPNQIEVITSEQMVDAYSSIGMPIFYHHWSFGKHFTRDWKSYQAGHQGLAYEIIINSNPCISYLMEENTMTMMALTMAHACVSGDTEYLTPTGWRRIDQYDGGQVGQYHEDGRVTFVQPDDYIKRKQDDFILVESEKISQAITDDHIVVLVNGNGNLIKITGDELARRQLEKTRGNNCKFITGFQIDRPSSLDMSDDEIRLHIAIKADGSIINPNANKNHHAAKPDYVITFDLTKIRKIMRLETLLNSMHIPYTKRINSRGNYDIFFRYPKIEKTFGVEWYSASREQLKVISEEVYHWDGSTQNENRMFFSVFKKDVDYIQYVWAALGFHAHLSKEKSCWKVTRSDRNLVSISKHGKDGRQKPESFARIPSEDGFAYCFRVNSGMLVIRRNDKITITNNCIGHNWFFANNSLFKEWTDADSIVDYLAFAKDYIIKCENREGRHKVETFIDSCHALMNYGVNRYKRPTKLSVNQERLRTEAKDDYKQSKVNELFDTLTRNQNDPEVVIDEDDEKHFPPEPEENILYFCEKYAPDLAEWQREIIRIVRKVAQYFYPQGQTKVINEGCATYTHYRIMTIMHDRGMMSDGSYLEFLASHTNVVSQPDYNSKYYSGINPYALGFAMMRDIERICRTPTAEDRHWFPDFAGCNDEMAILRDAWTNYRDESFIRQFLSPKVIRDFRLFQVLDDKDESDLLVSAIHNDDGYQKLRDSLADKYERHEYIPQIEVTHVGPQSKTLTLQYHDYKGRALDNPEIMIRHISRLWHKAPVYLYDSHGNALAHRNS